MQTLPALLSQVISLVSIPPGSLVYHLVLLFAFQAAAAIAFGQWRKGGSEARLFWAAAGLFMVRLVLLAAALLEAADLLPALAVIPPLDRAGSTLTILIIVWAFSFPKASRLADALTAALALVALIGLGISWGLWIQDIPPLGTALAYNGSAQESVWEIAQLALLLAGGVLVVARRGPAWYVGLMLVLLLLGVHGLQLFLPLSGNVPGVVRLVEIVALPMFTALVYQSVHTPLSPPTLAWPTLQLPASTVLAPSAVNARALVALASLYTAGSLEQRRQNLTLALGYLFQADLSLLILPPDKKGAAPVACCYHVSRGQFTSRPDLFIKAFPAVAAALEGGGATLLTSGEHEVELRRLGVDTGLEEVGFGLLAPLALSADYPLGAVALLASAARPAWTVEDQELLGALARSLAAVFDTADQITALRRENQSQQKRADAAEEQYRVAQETAQKLMSELAQAQTAVLQFTGQYHQAQSHAAGALDLAEAEQRRRDEERNRLEVELEAAQEGLAAMALLQNQCKTLAEEAEALRHSKAELEKQAEHLRGDLHAAETQLEALAASDHTLASEAQNQQTAQLRLELELARMELQGAADRRSALLEQAEKEKQALAEANQASLAAVQAELEEKNGWLRQLTGEWERVRTELQASRAEQQRREAGAEAQAASLTAELEQVRAEWQQALARAESPAEKETRLAELADRQQREAEQMAQAAERAVEWECLRAELHEAQAALAGKTLGLQQLAEQSQLRSNELTAQAESARAELQQAAERAASLEQEAQKQSARLDELQEALAAAQAALAEETLSAEDLARQHEQREARWAAQTVERAVELERVRAELQQALEQIASLEQSEKRPAARLEETQNALASAQSELADRAEQLRQLTEAHQQREAECGSTLEQTRAELKGALDRQSVLEKSSEDLKAQLREAQAALDTARTAISGQAAAFVSTQERLAEKERELAEALSNLPAARPSEMSPAAQTTLERVAILAQDLRQPVMSISGYASLLLGESVGVVGAVQKKFLERIQAACERLEALLNDLSQASEAAFGARPLTMTSVNVTGLVEEALQDSEALLREKGIHLRLELAQNAPQLQADAAALRRVFSGLIHNAASATPLNGEVRLTVRRETQTSREDGRTDCLFVSVKDSGSGLSPADLPKVFSSASRLEAPLAGLGDGGRELAALQPLVEAHHGRIWVTSEPGQGSLFVVMLPVIDGPASDAKNASPAALADPSLPVPKALDFLVLPPDK